MTLRRSNRSRCRNSYSLRTVGVMNRMNLTLLDLVGWAVYELAVAGLTMAFTVMCFRGEKRARQVSMEGGLGLLLVALLTAIGLGQWLQSDLMTAIIALGLASMMITSAAANVGYELGVREGRSEVAGSSN